MTAIKAIIPLIFSVFLFAGASLSLEAQNRKPTIGGVNSSSDPDSQDLELARQYYANEEYKKALSYLDKLGKKKMLPVVYELSLNCYLALEDYDYAEDLIKDYIKKIHGNNSGYYADLVYIYQKQGKNSKADEVVDDLLKSLRDNPGMAYSYANAFEKRGYPKIALEFYETAEQYIPSANYDYQKALLYGEMGDIQKMYTTYVQMVERSPNYLGTVRQLLARAIQEEDANSENTAFLKELLIRKIQAGGPESLNELLVSIFIQEKNFNAAFIQLKALDKRNNGSKGDIFNLGRVAMNNEEYDLARRIFAYIIKAGKDYPYYEQAMVLDLEAQRQALFKDENTAQAQWKELQKQYYESLKELKGEPQVAGLTIDLADLSAFQLEETDTAAGMLKKLISTGFVSQEDIARAKIKLGDILLYTGNRWDAIIYYGQAEKAFEQSPIGQEAKFKRARAAYFVGDFQWAQGIFDVLKASTSKLIANDAMRYSLLINDNIALDTNTEAMSMYARADLLNYQRKPDSALIVLNMMDIAFPDHSIQDEVLFLKAQILTSQKKYEEAAKNLQSLIDLYGDDILADDAIYALAQLYENHLQRTADAQALYQKLFTEHPDSFFASDARKRFRELRGDLVN